MTPSDIVSGSLVRVERKKRVGLASRDLPFVLRGSTDTWDLPEEVGYAEDILGVMEYLLGQGWVFLGYDGDGPVFRKTTTSESASQL